MYPVVKRALDFCAALVLLVVLSPLLALVALLVLATMGHPVFFRQLRPGRGARLFNLCKFRTMNDARDGGGKLLPDAVRLTGVGRALRWTSVDELPQLWNVLRGDMSFVGPRPLLKEYLARYTPEQARRHEVRPGITGWAQIHGRQDVVFSKRLAYDAWYVDHCSFWLDAVILVRTLGYVLTSRGVQLEQNYAEVDDIGLSVSGHNASGERVN